MESCNNHRFTLEENISPWGLVDIYNAIRVAVHSPKETCGASLVFDVKRSTLIQSISVVSTRRNFYGEVSTVHSVHSLLTLYVICVNVIRVSIDNQEVRRCKVQRLSKFGNGTLRKTGREAEGKDDLKS